MDNGTKRQLNNLKYGMNKMLNWILKNPTNQLFKDTYKDLSEEYDFVLADALVKVETNEIY